MELLKNKILSHNNIVDHRIVRVDNFLNHQLDISLLKEIGQEFKKRFHNTEVTKILTIETSGIAIASITSLHFNNVPVVFAKKYAGKNMSEEVYEAKVYSYTKDQSYSIKVSKEYISPSDKILIIDDFLASGSALMGLTDLVNQSGAEIAGIGIAIEKAFQNGGKLIRDKGYHLESLAIIETIEKNKIIFKDEIKC